MPLRGHEVRRDEDGDEGLIEGMPVDSVAFFKSLERTAADREGREGERIASLPEAVQAHLEAGGTVEAHPEGVFFLPKASEIVGTEALGLYGLGVKHGVEELRLAGRVAGVHETVPGAEAAHRAWAQGIDEKIGDGTLFGERTRKADADAQAEREADNNRRNLKEGQE